MSGHRRNPRVTSTIPLIILVLWALAPNVGTSASAESLALQGILDGWADALGGREQLEASKTVYSRSKLIAFGLEGEVEEWVSADGRHRVDLDLAGLYTTTTVKTENGCWLRDQNGKVSNQAGFDLESEISAVYQATWSHLLPDRMAGHVEYLGKEPETGHLIVACTPEDGIKVTFYIDMDRFLPVRSQQLTSGGDTQTTAYEAWRKVDGVLFPASVKLSTGIPENDMVFLLEEITLNVVPDSTVFVEPTELADDVAFLSGSSTADIPLDINGVHLFVQVRVNDSEPLWFALDTGASVTVLDSKIAAELGLTTSGTIMVRGSGEERPPASFLQDVSFGLPGVELSGQTVAVLALSDILESRLGRRIDGVLGYDFISRFVVEIDYWNSTLHLYDRHSFTYDGPGEEVPIRLVGSHPHCDAVFTVPGREPIRADFLIDSGSGMAVSFNYEFSTQNDLMSTLPKTVLFTGAYGIGGESKAHLGRIEQLRIGSLEFVQPSCEFVGDERRLSETQGVSDDVTTAGLLGGLIWEQCTVIFDYERQRMILEPNQRLGKPIDIDMSGITFSTGGRDDWHTFTILHIIPHSPADRAGLEVGDIIVSIDGRPATEFWAADVRSLFRQEGREVSLGISRGDETFEKTLRLHPII